LSFNCFGQGYAWLQDRFRRQQDPMANLAPNIPLYNRVPGDMAAAPIPNEPPVVDPVNVRVPAPARVPPVPPYRPVVPQPVAKGEFSSLKRSTSPSYPRTTRCQGPYFDLKGQPRLPPKIPLGNRY
jgi:hypothetical protein